MMKSTQEMLEDVLVRLRSEGGITETSAGSIARMFAEVLIEEFGPFYGELDLAKSMAYVSSSQGAYLEMIGELLNCPREYLESDENYRARITNQVTVQQNANLTAIRLKALLTQGVADVQFKRYTHGTGSFTCYVTPEIFPIQNNLLARVEQVLEDTAAYGMAFDVKTSEYTPVDVTINLIMNTKSTSLERQHVRSQVQENITAYMNGLAMGETVIVNEIVQRVMETSSSILDLEFKQLMVGEKEYFIKNIEPSLEERFFLRKLTVV